MIQLTKDYISTLSETDKQKLANQLIAAGFLEEFVYYFVFSVSYKDVVKD